MENTKENQLTVPYVVYRDAISDNRRTTRLWAAIAIIAIILMFASNAIWLYAWNQYDITTESVETTVDSEGDGVANYTGGDGGVIIGEGYGAQNPDDAY